MTAIIPIPPVTLVTALAQINGLSDAEYRALYQRVAAGRSLRELATALRTAVSHTWWGNYARGDKQLDRARKNELRAWAGLPELPPSVVEAVAAGAHADAAVYRVGVDIANRVVLVGADVPALDLRVNGSVSVAALPQNARVTAVTAPRKRQNTKGIHLSPNVFERLNTARRAAGCSWDEYLTRLSQASV